MHNELDPAVAILLLSCFPVGTQVIAAQSYRPGYLPYPMRVQLQTPVDGIQSCVVKISHSDLIARESQVLRFLARLGLPVPKVLSEPMLLPSEERVMIVLSELPGRALPWCGITSLAEADLTCRLVLEAVARLHQLTDHVREHCGEVDLPQNTLQAEYADIIAEAGEWRRVSTFERAIEVIGRSLSEATSPLVFSNGDYNPLNFLYDGQALCGFVDFEGACFENPHIGFAKFLIWSQDEYGWGTGIKVGLVERYLYTRNVSRREFAPILILRCLRHLIRDVSIEGGNDQEARKHILQKIEEGLQIIGL